MTKNKDRLFQLDVLRSIAILTIVFYHLPGNLGSDIYWLSNAYYTLFINFAVWFALSLFFFISGFGIDINHKSMRTRREAMLFYGKRAKRIYPLYWLAILIVFLLPLAILRLFQYAGNASLLFKLHIATFSASALLVDFAGLQAILGSSVDFEIYWFISVVLIYYFLYPFIVVIASNSTTKVIAASAVFFIPFVMARAVINIEPRFFLYYFMFVFGIVVNRLGILEKRQSKRTLSLLLVASVMLTSTYFQLFPNSQGIMLKGFATVALYTLVFDITFFFWVLLALDLASRYSYIMKEKSRSFWSYVAFSSYCVFLFHQFYLSLIRASLRDVAHLSYVQTLAFSVLIGVPILIVLSFGIQKKTNRTVDRLFARMHLLV